MSLVYLFTHHVYGSLQQIWKLVYFNIYRPLQVKIELPAPRLRKEDGFCFSALMHMTVYV